MSGRIPVRVQADDPISQAGVVSGLRLGAGLEVVDGDDARRAAVAVLVAHELDETALGQVRALRSGGCPRVVVVLGRVDDATLVAAAGAGACALLRRSDARPDRLAGAVRAAAAGDGLMPPDLLGRLLDQLARPGYGAGSSPGRVRPMLSEREIDVLRLASEGFDTREIAGKLCYCERTVKSVVHDVTVRLNLRNRTHAVAYAVRQGLI